MRYYIFPTVLFLLFPLTIYGQQVWTGKIFDATSNFPIEGVNISIVNSPEGTTSDLLGRFQLELKEPFIKLRFSHLGYETYELELSSVPDTLLMVYLIPIVNVLEQVEVNATNESVPLSDVRKCSLLDFEIVANKIIRLEYHGSFKSRTLSMTNLAGNIEAELELKKIRNIEGLYQTCTNTVYVLTNAKAYLISLDFGQLNIQQAIRIDSFNLFVRPCKVKMKENLYYLYESHNGLRRMIYAYNPVQQRQLLLRSISDEDIIANYQQDLGRIRYGQNVSNIRTNDSRESRRIRRAQANANFLTKVFYKPEFPVEIHAKKGRLLIFNQPEKQIEVFENNELQHITPIEYISDKKWIEKLAYDAVQEQTYVLFNGKYGTLFQRLNPITGKLQIATSLDIYDYQVKKMIVHDGWIYYIKSERIDGQNKQLRKLKI